MDKPNAQQRIEEAVAYGIRTKKAFTPREWCESAGLAGGSLATFKTRFGRGDQERLSYDVAEKLATFLGISVAWLHAGKGEMLDASSATPAPRAATHEPGDRLVLEIGNCQNEKLRQALLLFWFEHRDEPARHAVTRFLYDQDFKSHEILPFGGRQGSAKGEGLYAFHERASCRHALVWYQDDGDAVRPRQLYRCGLLELKPNRSVHTIDNPLKIPHLHLLILPGLKEKATALIYFVALRMPCSYNRN